MQDSAINERLAKIEINQSNQQRQLEKVLALLDRMVKVEERQQTIQEKYGNLLPRMESAERELTSWRTARTIFAWVVGLLGTTATGIAILVFQYLINNMWVVSQ